MSRFEWEADGDEAWNEGEWEEQESNPKKQGGIPWLTILLIIVGLGSVTILIYRQIEKRAEEARLEISGEILSSFRLIRFATRTDDPELFETLLSGREIAWTQAQRDLFAEGITIDRNFIGLQALTNESMPKLGEPGDPNSISIEFAPNLLEAEMGVPQIYAMDVGNGVTETVNLRQTAVFRRGKERWLIAPPDDDFWGLRARRIGRYMTVDYPQRDSEVAGRMAFDLDAKIEEFCNNLVEIQCPENLHVSIYLETDPESLIMASDPANTYRQNLMLRFPTITLLGSPVDEAGYQALYRVYAAQMISAVLAQLVEWECCSNVSIFQALVDYQLDQLGLRPWPITEGDYQRVLVEGVDLEEIGRFWVPRNLDSLQSRDGWQVYVLIEFLSEQLSGEITIISMMRLLPKTNSFEFWLRSVGIDPSISIIGVPFLQQANESWLSFMIERAAANQAPSPISFPDQDINLLCGGNRESSQLTIFRYQFGEDVWRVDHIASDTTFLVGPLPQDDGLLISSIEFNAEMEDEVWQTRVWQMEISKPIEVEDQEDQSVLTLGQMDPSGEYLTLYGGVGATDSPPAGLVDWRSCLDGRCEFIPLAGSPVWSPKGSGTLLTENGSIGIEPLRVFGRVLIMESTDQTGFWELYRGDRTGQPLHGMMELVSIGQGSSPFWLDEFTYGYLRGIAIASFAPAQELVIASVVDDVPQPLLTLTELRATGDFSEDLLIRMVFVNPNDSNMMFVAASESMDKKMDIFSLDRRTGQIQLLFDVGFQGGESIDFSPDGRYLVVTGIKSRNGDYQPPDGVILLYDIVRGNLTRYYISLMSISPLYDWSADGRWLAIIVDDHLLNLVAPAYDYQQYLVHELGSCGSIAWINRG